MWPILAAFFALTTAVFGWMALRAWLGWRTADARYESLLASIPPEAYDLMAARLAGIPLSSSPKESSSGAAAQPGSTAPAPPKSGGTSGDSKSAGQNQTTAAQSEANKAAPAATSPPVKQPANTSPAPSPSPPRATVESIKAQYMPRFQVLQAECEGRLSALIEQGKKEVKSLQTLGGSVAELVPKYEREGLKLKTECDGRFQALVGVMGAELKRYGLPQDLVTEAQDAYAALTKRKQAELMAQFVQR